MTEQKPDEHIIFTKIDKDEIAEYVDDTKLLNTVAGRAEVATRLADALPEIYGDTDKKQNAHRSRCDAYELMSMFAPEPRTRRMTAEEEIIYIGAMQAANWKAEPLGPYFGLLTPMFSWDAPTLGTDRDFRIIIGPWFFDPMIAGAGNDSPQTQVTVRATLLIHEIMHPTLRNIREMNSVELGPPDDHELGNIAEDFVINEGVGKIDKTRFPMRNDGSLFGAFANKTQTKAYPKGLPLNKSYRWYYNELAKDNPPSPNNIISIIMDDNSSGSGHGSGNGDSKDNDKPSQDGSDAKNNENKNNAGGKQGVPSSCSGVSDEIEKVLDQLGVRKVRRSEMNSARIQSINIAEGEGKNGIGSSSEFNKWFVGMTHPAQVSWQQIFSRAFRHSAVTMTHGYSDRSYRRVNRRGNPISPNVIRPGHVGYKTRVLMGVDSSGSMIGSRFITAVSEVKECINSLDNIDLDFMNVDADIHAVQTVSTFEKLNFEGGGGTIMSVFYEYIDSLKHKPDIDVLISDCEILDDDAEKITEYMRKMKSIQHYIISVGGEDYASLFKSSGNCTFISIKADPDNV